LHLQTPSGDASVAEVTARTRELPRLEEREVKFVTMKKLIFRRFMRHKLAVFGGYVIFLMLLFAFVGPFITPFQPDQVNLRERFAKPSIVMIDRAGQEPIMYNLDAIQNRSAERPLKFGHPLGTDDLGRDTMTRAMFGGRVSLGIGLIVALISVASGVTLGAISGYLGGWWDNVIMRFNDVENSLPDLPILMVLSKIFPPGFWTMCLILVALSAFRGMRIARAMTLSLKHQLFSEAAQSLGADWRRLIFRHFVPNSLSPLFVTVTLAAGGAIRSETSLSYLGLGIQPPMPSWGNMLSNAQQYFFSAPWLVFFPGICIFLTLFSFNLIGDGLRDAFDPRMVRR
jgi:peptide/nickel transport system permease protein